MELSYGTCLSVSCSMLLYISLVLCTSGSTAILTDRLSLLAFKDGITDDPFGALRSWNDTVHFCKWGGIRCGHRHRRVTVLDLHACSLVGSLSPHIANLTFIRGISLGNNKFHGQIPQEIGRLFRLQYLNLTQNSFAGEIPANLSHCSNLQHIEFFNNELIGNIPVQLGSLSKLVLLGLGANLLTGSIPPSLGNLSSLTQISLSENKLEGNIPDELGRLSRLILLRLSVNELSGSIPPSLYNLSLLLHFVVSSNRLHGSLPNDIGLTLPNLQYLIVGENQFTGHIPVSIANASRMEHLGMVINNFTGSVPANLGSLRSLRILNLGRNQLGSMEADDMSFLTSLTNCSKLQVLALDDNQFRGVLPNSVVNLSTQLQILVLGANMISGAIPSGIENLISLIQLGMENNLLTGILPSAIGNLQLLQQLSIFGNKFSGQIPSSLGNITLLSELNIDENNLQGSIPSSLGNLQHLTTLDLSDNNLNGTIPKPVLLSLTSLSIYLDLARNSLTGSLPLEVGNLKNVGILDVSENKLSGEIPSTIGDCSSLEELYLNGNFFQGTIPPSLTTLKTIRNIDLSRNNLSGQIPKYLGMLAFLQNLNLSFNNLEGEVPKEGVFRNMTAFSVSGNDKLCGGITELNLPPCPTRAAKKRRRHLPPKLMIPIISSVLCLIIILGLLAVLSRKTRKKPSPSSSFKDSLPKVSYSELLKATNGFSSANLIGVGSYGTVYKGILDHDGTVIAVKVLNLQRRGASKSFMAECEALRNIRHRNLVKILTSCSSMDFKGDDFKALVFEFLSNGSLEEWLHPNEDRLHESWNLSLIHRLNIAIDVASAIDYLHNHCQMPVVHCDLKPSNILLDEDMTAHVADFGLARLRAADDFSQNETTSVGLKGSIGYVAPEYGMGDKVSTHGDVYSYGILLLEMFTGRRPVDDMFKDGLSLHKFVKLALPEQVINLIDHQLFIEEGEGEEEEEEEIQNGKYTSEKRNQMHDCLVSIFKIGLSCSVESPRERMEMKDVVRKMHRIRDLYLGDEIH